MDNITSNYTYEEKKYVGDDLKITEAAAKNISQVDAAINDLLKGPYVKISDYAIMENPDAVKNALPIDGTLTFIGYPDEILRTLRTLLDGRKIEMTVDWTIIDK